MTEEERMAGHRAVEESVSDPKARAMFVRLIDLCVDADEDFPIVAMATGTVLNAYNLGTPAIADLAVRLRQHSIWCGELMCGDDGQRLDYPCGAQDQSRPTASLVIASRAERRRDLRRSRR